MFRRGGGEVTARPHLVSILSMEGGIKSGSDCSEKIACHIKHWLVGKPVNT